MRGNRGVPGEEARSWKIIGQKRRMTRQEYQRLLHKFEMEGSIAQKRIVEPRLREKIMREKRIVTKGKG